MNWNSVKRPSSASSRASYRDEAWITGFRELGLEKLAMSVGQDLVVGIGRNLTENPSIAKLVSEGLAVVRRSD